MRNLLLIAFTSVAFAYPSTRETEALEKQNIPELEKLVAEYSAGAARSPGSADAQYQAALASSYLAEVFIEKRDRKSARRAAEQGFTPAQKAIALKPGTADYYRVLAMLYGQAITDIMSGLGYGPKAKEAINKAVELAPRNASMYVARGVGNYYLPAQVGGGAAPAIADFHKAIELEPNNYEAYLWLGVALRKNNQDVEARKAFTRSLELNPRRVWTKEQLDKTPAAPAK
jgi:Flp pilus assembly protein TadD